MYGRGKKLSKTKIQNNRNPFILKRKKRIKNKIVRDIWTLFETEEEKEERKKLERKRLNERLIKERIIRDIRTLFEQEEEDYYKPKRVNSL